MKMRSGLLMNRAKSGARRTADAMRARQANAIARAVFPSNGAADDNATRRLQAPQAAQPVPSSLLDTFISIDEILPGSVPIYVVLRVSQ